MTRLLLALAFVFAMANSALAETVAFSDVEVLVPAGWRHTEKSAALYLVPANLPQEKRFVIWISRDAPGEASSSAGSIDVWWRYVSMGGEKILERSASRPFRTASGLTGLASSGVIDGPKGQVSVAATVFDAADARVVISLRAPKDSDTKVVDMAYSEVIDSLKFTKASNPAREQLPAPAKSEYELLLFFASGLNASTTGGVDFGSSTYLYCIFPDGSWRDRAPRPGLYGYSLADDRGANPGNFGTWQQADGALQLRTPYRVETLYPQPDNTYVRKDAAAREATYFRVPTSTGLRIAGRYIKSGQSDGPTVASIVFQADGRFADSGIVRLLGGVEVGVKYGDISEVLGPGSGTYEVFSNTLVLSFADGRRKHILLALTPKLAAKKDPEAIYLDGVWLKKT